MTAQKGMQELEGRVLNVKALLENSEKLVVSNYQQGYVKLKKAEKLFTEIGSANTDLQLASDIERVKGLYRQQQKYQKNSF